MDITVDFPLFLFLISLASPFGIPLGETFFILSAGSISVKLTDYVFFVTLIFFGLIIGDIAAYSIASHFKTGLAERLCRYDRYKKTCELSECFFNRHGALSVFLSRFLLLGFGAPVNYLSGLSKYSFKKFLISAASGEFIYAVTYTYIGFAFRDSWASIFNVIARFTLTTILVLSALFALFLSKKYLISRSNK